MARKAKKRKKRSRGPQRAKASTKESTLVRGQPVAVKSRAHFERYLASGEPVLVDFWASWCGPCRAMAPIFERVAHDEGERAYFLKVDTERVPELAEAFGIRAIPTLIAIVGDQVVDSNIGLSGEKELAAMVQRAADRAAGVTFVDKLKRAFSAA